jgi:dienelactone hydrolase
MFSPPNDTHHEDEKLAGPAGPVGRPQGRYNQQLWWIPIESSRQLFLLEAMVYTPSGAGPFPLAIINHGKPTPGSDTRLIRPGFDPAARWFVDRGFVVAVLLRRGYGHSQGPVADMAGTCATMDYLATAEQTGRDIEGAVEFLIKQSKIASQVVLVGHSHGAFGDLSVAANSPKNVVGIVDFAGGTGNWGAYNLWERLRQILQGKFCNGRQRLLSALEQLGQRNSVPEIWLYAENDRTFNPELARAMLNAYQEGSRVPITFASLPASVKDGHMLFAADAETSWAPAVNAFLKNLNIRGYVALN